MSEDQKSSNGGNLILLGVGLLCILCGSFLISECVAFASLFLRTTTSFGFPVSDADRLKILFVQGGGILAIAQGVVLFIAGFFRLFRYGALQGATVKPASR